MSTRAIPISSPIRARPLIGLAIVVLLAAGGCRSRPTASGAPPTECAYGVDTAVDKDPTRLQQPPSWPEAERVVAIGDLHGDLDAARRALRLAGAIDGGEHWAGGALVVVQTGDILDRGADEIAVVKLFERLTTEASAAGGAVIVLNGNHELRNVQGDFKYVAPAGFTTFATAAVTCGASAGETDGKSARAAALRPGGPLARHLARHNVIARVGDTLFVHGGLSPAHAEYGIARINAEVSAWMRGERPELPPELLNRDSPVWTRRYSESLDSGACAALGRALEIAKARRMVVGHTIQTIGINAGCDGRVWRIDVGMSRVLGGKVEVLEIENGEPRVLREEAGPGSQ